MGTSVTLPLALNSEDHRRLVLVKQVYESAISRASVESRSARMLALIDFDFSVETLLRMSFKALLPAEPVPKEFPTLLKRLHASLIAHGHAGIAEYGEIDRMHNIRNGVQHHAEYPAAEQIYRVRTATNSCLGQTIQTIWNEDLATVDEIDLVGSTRANNLLSKAKGVLNQDEPDYLKVLGYCWKAFTYMADGAKAAVIRGSRREAGMAIMLQGTLDRKYTDPALYDAMHNTQDLTLMIALGVDPVRYVQYLIVVGNMVETMGPATSILRSTPGMGNEVTDEEAGFVYSFVLESVIQIETRIGAINSVDQDSVRMTGMRGVTTSRIDLDD